MPGPSPPRTTCSAAPGHPVGRTSSSRSISPNTKTSQTLQEKSYSVSGATSKRTKASIYFRCKKRPASINSLPFIFAGYIFKTRFRWLPTRIPLLEPLFPGHPAISSVCKRGLPSGGGLKVPVAAKVNHQRSPCGGVSSKPQRCHRLHRMLPEWPVFAPADKRRL